MRSETPVKVTDMSSIAASPMPSIDAMVSRTAQQLAAYSDQFLGPGIPMNSFRGQYPPRTTDYPASDNVRISPGRPFILLQNLASWDPVRYCIERRKAGIKSRKWAIVATDPDAMKTGKYAKQIKEIDGYWKMPDKQNKLTLDLWMSVLLEQSFLWDASPIMRWPTRDGKGIACHRIIDGKTITPKWDSLGNIPMPPGIAYQQVIKGIPLTEYTSDQMIYPVRNPRPDSLYGMSEVEWLLIAVNIALRRDTSDLLHWTAGNVPYGFGETPEDWTPEQIVEWGKAWDDMLAGEQSELSKIKWGPKGMNFHEFQQRNKGNEDWKFYEWSARRACAIFGVAPTPYTGSVNRATAETAEEAQGELAEEPLCQWIESLITTEIQTTQAQPDLCFRFISEKSHNELEAAEANERKIFSGQISLDTILNEAGQDEIGIPPFVMVPGTGIVYLKGQSPEYMAKYKKFFEMQDEEEAAKIPPAANPLGIAQGQKVENPAASPSTEVKEDGTLGAAAPKEKKEAPPATKEEKALAAHNDLRKWKRIAIRSLRDGRPIQKFESESIPTEVQYLIVKEMDSIRDFKQITDTFDDAFKMIVKLT